MQISKKERGQKKMRGRYNKKNDCRKYKEIITNRRCTRNTPSLDIVRQISRRPNINVKIRLVQLDHTKLAIRIGGTIRSTEHENMRSVTKKLLPGIQKG